VFCDQHQISGSKTASSIDHIIESIDSIIKGIDRAGEYGAPIEIAFYGGSFTSIPAEEQVRLLLAAAPLLDNAPRNTIRVSTRPDCIDKCSLERLIAYRVSTVELGAQSMCDDVLLKSQRGHTARDVEMAAALVKQAGLSLILQMMTGLPGDLPGKSVITAKRFIGLRPDGVRIYPAVVIKGTLLYEMWRRGEYQEQSLDEAVELCAVLCSLFKEAQIPVIRLGLNPTEALSAGAAVAGAYHPAFGEMVYSKMYYKSAAALLKGAEPGDDVTIAVKKGCLSKFIGNKRCNIDALISEFSLGSLKVIESELVRDDVLLVTPDHNVRP